MLQPRLILLTVSLFFCYCSFSQDTVWLTKGLAIYNVHHYGREALYTDKLAFQLYNNTLLKPAPGNASGIDDDNRKPVQWQTIDTDSLRRFRGRMFSNGYAYFTYISDKEKSALINVSGAAGIFFNGVPHAGDAYASGWLYIPVQLKKGSNELYVRMGGRVNARIIFPATPVQLNTEDPTLPAIVQGNPSNALQGAVVVINTTNKDLKGLQIKSLVAGRETTTVLPVVPRLSTRKCAFTFNGSGVTDTGKTDCVLTLINNGKQTDTKTISIQSVHNTDQYSSTFTSAIDGSLQYYAVTPQVPAAKAPSALFLSVHGAGVEAIGQARAYAQKDWGNLVAATNRRPRGFNWEDWGRLDALEVLHIATEKFQPDPQHIYLTGHSMGGHGTWFLGATYPDKWAGIAPCSGYPTLKEYGSADGAIPTSGANETEQMLLRASNQSDVVKLASNYKSFGVYILHGDSDMVVPVKYARQMRGVLADFHADMSYYEYPGGEHWFGNQSVDWPPLFAFLKWHSRPVDSAVHHIDFTTASPGISATYRWATILQQMHPLQYSHIVLQRQQQKKSITGTTTNVRTLQLAFNAWPGGTPINILLDSTSQLQYTTKTGNDSVCFIKENNEWRIAEKPGMAAKGPLRYGTFKDPFNNRMIFVYGTKGNAAENEWSFNKARYDAETWYYRGNGSMDIIADKDYDRQKYAGRNVIVYGNAATNSVYNLLVGACPLRVERNLITVGNHTYTGVDLATYFVWPMADDPNTSVGVVGGTGIKGMMAANANQYFAGASGFPDFMIFSLSMLQQGTSSVKATGFFDHNWKLQEDDAVFAK